MYRSSLFSTFVLPILLLSSGPRNLHGFVAILEGLIDVASNRLGSMWVHIHLRTNILPFSHMDLMLRVNCLRAACVTYMHIQHIPFSYLIVFCYAGLITN